MRPWLQPQALGPQLQHPREGIQFHLGDNLFPGQLAAGEGCGRAGERKTLLHGQVEASPVTVARLVYG